VITLITNTYQYTNRGKFYRSGTVEVTKDGSVGDISK